MTVNGIALRLGTGLVGIGLVAATIWAAQTFPLPGLTVSPPSAVLSPVPGDQLRVCQGPLALLGESSSRPTDTGYKGYAEMIAAGAVADLDLAGLAPAVETLVPPAAPQLDATGVPVAVSAPGIVGDRATMLTMAQTVAVTSPGPAGFAATPCRTPTGDQWLVGGATTAGSSTMLSLVNASERAAIVRVELYGEAGPLAAPGLDGIEVPPRSQIAVALEGVAPQQRAFAVHVGSRGGRIAAALHEVAIEGLASHGVEIVGSAGSPSTRLDFVGVPFPTQSNEEDESVFAKRGATLRLFAPGAQPTTATITLRDASGTALEPLEVVLQPGVVSDVPLGAYPVGRYSIAVEADAPVTGGVRASLAGDQVDFAWYSASPRLSGETAVAVPPGPGPRLHLTNTGDAPATVRVSDARGSTAAFTVEPGQTVSRDVVGGAAYVLDGLAGVAASITYDGPGQMAGIPVLSGNPLAADITVYR